MIQFAMLAKNAGRFISDNSPAILTAVSAAGVVSTSIFAVRATPNALRDIWDAESERTEPLTNSEKIRLCWRYYVPALSVGAATIACIIGANTVHQKRQAALMSVYSLTEKAFKEYQDKVVEQIGETKEQKVRDSVAQDRVTQDPVENKQVIITGNGDVLCYDSLTGRYFNSNIDAIRKAENKVNAHMINEMYASVNEFFTLLGLPPTKMGEELGWRLDNGILELEFSSTLSEGDKPCLVINYKVVPTRNYHKIW